MSNKHKTDWKLREVTDEEVYDAIRYLEPGPSSECDDSTAFAIGLSAVILLLGLLAYFWPIP
jgi:hypothetical protein